ncbi:MAG: large-conductance mechanosensitive channel protein MscL [Flavobacteriales bacterium]
MMKEFKEFAMKGNLVDIAVGFVMGAAFVKVVNAFTGGIVAPVISLLTEKVKFDELKVVLRDAVKDGAGVITSPEVAITYGMFLTALIDFIIVAFVMFMVIKAINKMKKAEPAPAPAGPTDDQKLLMEIRDALKK